MANKTIIIAEAGVNHNGSIENARLLIDSAKNAGADFIKFQTFKTELNISTIAQKAAYQAKNTSEGTSESQYEMVKKLELSNSDFNILESYSRKVGIKFLSTAFDEPSLSFIAPLIDIIKVPSGEITNYPYLKQVAQLNKGIVLSTGMADLGEIEDALQVLTSEGLDRSAITVLHCNTEYPTPMQDVNLKAMLTIQQAFGVKVGYSDHTLGIEVPIAAVALGATVIEKHFTLDRNLPGPDHRASLEPKELKAMVKAIRNIELAVGGHGRKQPSDSEVQNKTVVRKSLHAQTLINEDEVISEKHLIPLRPGNGISPMDWKMVVGRKASETIQEGQLIKWTDLK